MKKNLFYYLFAVICSACVFTACSDDDEDTTWQQIPEITKENVTLKLNDKTSANATATLDIINAESGKLTLTNAIYGHSSVKVDVTLQKKDDTSYNFSGTADLDPAQKAMAAPVALKVAVSGTVNTTGKMTVDVVTSGWAAVSGVYTNDSVSVAINGGKPASNYGVTLEATAEDVVNLTFAKLVNIANDFEMEVSLKDSKIEGSKEKEPGYLISVTGTLVGDKLDLNVTTSGWATLSGTYSFKDHHVTYNGAELSSGYFTIKMTAEDKADITFANLLSGSREGAIKGAAVTVKDGVYTIKGKNEADGYTLTFDGTINAERALAAAVTYVTVSPIVGTWSPTVVEAGGNKMVVTDIQFATNTGSVTFAPEIIGMLPAELKPMFQQPLPDAQLVQVLQGLLGSYAVYLKSLTFTEDGRLIVKYINMPKDTNGDGKIDMNDANDFNEQIFALLQYYISEGKLYLTVNLMDLMKMSPKAAWNPGEILTAGIPFNMVVNDGTALISLDQYVLNTETVESVNGLLGAFGSMIPGFAEQTELINTVMGAVISILKDTKTLSVGMSFTKQ